MNEQPYEYRTGQTQPHKSNRGLVAFLLICVIFLCGLVSILGMMNVHLLSKLQQANANASLSFQNEDTTPVTPEGESVTVDGITVQELSQVYQQLYNLPEGLYVVDAPEGCPVLPGDVLTAFADSAVSSLDTLKTLKNNCQPGQRIYLTFFRPEGETFTYTTLYTE